MAPPSAAARLTRRAMDQDRRQHQWSERRAVVEAELARLSTEPTRAASWAVVAGELRAMRPAAEAAPGAALHLLNTLLRLVQALGAGRRPVGQAALGLVGEGLHDLCLLCAESPLGAPVRDDLTGAMELLMADLAGPPVPVSSLDARLEDFVRRDLGRPRRRAAALAAESATRLEAVWSGLADYVRRQGEALGKRVELVATGGELEVSGRAGEALRPALLQLIRNACAHGVESPAARQGAGKPGLAILRLSARRAGDRVEVTLADDGRGLEGARKPAHPTDFFTGASLTDFPDGVSASTSAGGGLEQVRGAVEEAGGRLAHSSTPGRGAAFTMTLPAPPQAAGPPAPFAAESRAFGWRASA